MAEKKFENVNMKTPNHVAIIMDGNGRWAKKRGLPRIYGHREGGKRIKELVKEAKKLDVKVFTIFAFSTENWDRPKREIDYLFSYMEKFLGKYEEELVREGIRLKMLGRRDRIPSKIIKKIESVERATMANEEFFLNLALDFGGRWDITQAVKRVTYDCLERKIRTNQITEDLFCEYLSLAGMPVPDLLIRTSGEQRISNFLLWDLAYAEFYFSPVYWPDFDAEQLRKAFAVYAQRNRRFGGIS